MVESGVEKQLDWNDDVIMTSSEVAKFLKVHLGSVRRWTRTGELKGYRLGERGDWRYIRGDVLNFLFKYSQTASK
ncbi:MAG TPA: helix-turn-helix domain-containing protein [Dehalococcoidia bacterium]|nr:helix-turn-helix domain-containing protein [Dehalococcoidia bacterium]